MKRLTIFSLVFAALSALMALAGCVSSGESSGVHFPVVTSASIGDPHAGQTDLASTWLSPTTGFQHSAARNLSGTDSIASCLSDRQILAQLVSVLLKPEEMLAVKPLAARGEIGMISLLGKPDQSIKSAIDSLQQVSPVPLLIASDEETSKVQRLSRAIYPLPSARTLLTMSTEEVRQLYADYGRRMLALGVAINFAPVIDIGRGPGIGSRSFGHDPAVVSRYGHAVAAGLLDAGVLPVFKHFPGHGMASADSHDSLPVTKSIDAMSEDLLPYRELLHLHSGVMIGHLVVPGLSDGLPGSLSRNTINSLLRESLGFDGIVFTDALNMGAIADHFTSTEAALLALEAGADVVMISGAAKVPKLLDSLQRALQSGRLSRINIERSALKILNLKNPSTSICST